MWTVFGDLVGGERQYVDRDSLWMYTVLEAGKEIAILLGLTTTVGHSTEL